MDILPLQYTDEVVGLLRRGVEVYCLRRTTLISKKREELKLTTKTAKNDVKALMAIEDRWFRRVDENFLVLRRMIAAYRTQLKTHQQLVNRAKALSELERDILKPNIKTAEKQMEVMAAMIAEEAGKRYPAYDKLVGELGIGGKPPAMEALAEIVVYVDGNKGFVKTANYFGLFKAVRGRKKIYDGRLRQALQRLTASVNNIPSTRLTAKLEKKTLWRVWKAVRETQGRLAIPAQQG